jgi:hypothetical protein
MSSLVLYDLYFIESIWWFLLWKHWTFNIYQHLEIGIDTDIQDYPINNRK